MLIEQLKKLPPQAVSSLMGISDKLGTLNYDRFQRWSLPFTPQNARQALLAFKGDVYLGLNAYAFDSQDFDFAQRHLRILSGLYGVLKPLDLIQPYRLEMGTKLSHAHGANLYQFWGDTITAQLNKTLKPLDEPVLVNLASGEYFKSIKKQQLSAPIITPVFKDWKNGDYKIISFFAKKARGLMSAYIIKNRMTDAEQMKDFDWQGYGFNEALSNASEWVFTRKQD